MKKTTSKIIQALTGASAIVTLYAGKAMALTSVEEGAQAARAEGMPAELVGPDGVITRITNIVLLAIGFISVIMLLYGGFRYIVSGGDSKKVTDAKNTILYAIIGLVIALLAYAIVNFVLTTIGITSVDGQ